MFAPRRIENWWEIDLCIIQRSSNDNDPEWAEFCSTMREVERLINLHKEQYTDS